MGVPKFTAWLEQQQRNNNYFVIHHLNKIDNLFIDANSTIYDVFGGLKDLETVVSIDDLENRIIEGLKIFYDNLVEKTKPKMVYIAIDGVVPYSKITQQRLRRYTSCYMDNCEEKRCSNEIVNNWHPNSNISPGTPFMKKLDKAIDEYVKMKNVSGDIKYLYSSFACCGEGEHKIIQYIKAFTRKDINVIYGNDTDIIFLSLIIYLESKTQIYLYKPNKNQYRIFNVSKIRDVLFELIKMNIIRCNDSYEVDDNNIFDFIVLCFVIGNDFLQKNPLISAFELNYVINSYCDALTEFKGKNIIEITKDKHKKYQINYYNLMKVMNKLDDKEVSLFVKLYKENKMMIRKHGKIYESKTQQIKQKEKNMIEKIRRKQEDYDYFDTITVDERNIVQLQTSLLTYKYNYYNFYLKTNNTVIIDQMIKNYFEGFNWTVDYYLNVSLDDIMCSNCYDWSWYYRYPTVPFVHDLCVYLNKHYEEMNEMNKYHMKDTKPLNTNQQLFYIIPKTYLKTIDKLIYDKLNEYEFLTPISTNIDTIHKTKLFECHCIIPLVDYDIIENINI